MVERTQAEFLNAQADLVEKARDASQLAAKRAQDAETRTRGVETQTKVLRDQAEEVLSQVAERQSQIEATIGANVPEHEWSGTQLRLRNPDGEWGALVELVGGKGDQGFAGWSPVIFPEVDGERVVLRVDDWVGGTGPKPTLTGYLGTAGIVAAVADAINVRGPEPEIDIAIGTVTTLAAGTPATASLTETSPGVYEIDLGIPSGQDGEDAINGTDGVDGVSVTGAAINGLGELILTLSDASTVNAGEIPVSREMSRDLIRLSLEVALLKDAPVDLDSGVVDQFEDASGVDAAGSTNESAQSGYYRNTSNPAYTETTQSLPAMTSNTLPAGHVASASGEAQPAYLAFDKVISTSNRWQGTTGIPAWVQRQVPSPIIVREYRISVPDNNPFPTSWTLQGSNNGSSWSTIDSRSGIAFAANETKSFTIPANNTAYTHYRLTVSAVNQFDYVRIVELQLLRHFPETWNAMALVSVPIDLPTTPSKASMLVAAKAIGGSITPNTHLVAYASRDGGTTWTQGTLILRETLGDGTGIYETGEFDISAQPAGTSGKWRVVTGDAFEVQVHAVAVLFGG